MNTMIRFALLTVLAVGLSASAVRAAEETLSGTLVCAKCALKKADAAECQDVLLVKNAKGETVEYYVEKNKIAEDAGDACTVEVKATITGTVSEKEGKKWIAPSKIERA